MLIKPPTKIEVRQSAIHGLGVFCNHKIEKNETIEICPFLVFPQSPQEKLPVFSNYSFCFPRSDVWTNHAFVLGYGSLYNHSEEPNADWYTTDNNYTFFALRDMEPDEEILINYANGSVF